MKTPKLLTRDQFRNSVFSRDQHKCVICGRPAVDAHHIIERRLFPDGGYYLDNGSSLCEEHHLLAESTEISCETIRVACGIQNIVLPPHFEKNLNYTKWGDVILPDGRRSPGELFGDESVQRILGSLVSLYVNRFKYPRTYHLPWSPGATRDDRTMKSLSGFEGREVVVTEKMDGENTTLYRDGIHARSLNYSHHPSRSKMKAFHKQIAFEIPEGWRICGENLTAVHSIEYESLPHFFMVFSIWNEYNWCLSWDDTVGYSDLLGLVLAPTLYRGPFDRKQIESLSVEGKEGYVVRPVDSFHFREFRSVVGKFVRANHVQTSSHWMHQSVNFNRIEEN